MRSASVSIAMMEKNEYSVLVTDGYTKTVSMKYLQMQVGRRDFALCVPLFIHDGMAIVFYNISCQSLVA